MSELPHYFGLDFSGALSWIFAGFLGGLLLSWLWRALRGSRIDAKAEARIGEIQSLLDTSKSEHQADVSRLLSDHRNFEQALAEAERRASLAAQDAGRLKDEAERLSQAELASRNDLLAADGQMAKLRSSLQWAETQSKTAAQELQTLAGERQSLAADRQSFAAELATARTASELKDAEIARLINQVQWHEQRASALEQEKYGLVSGLSSLKSGESQKDAEIAHLKGEIAAAQAALARQTTDTTAQVQTLSLAQTKYDQAWKDLTYMRNLAYWQASEIERLRSVVTRFEGDVAGKDASLERLAQNNATLLAKLTGRGGGGAAHTRNRIAYFRRQGTNGTSADAHAHAKGAGKIALGHRREAGKSLARGKAYKIGKAFAAAGRAARGGEAGLVALAGNNRLVARRVGIAELTSLKAKVAELSDDAEKYRRLREAVHVANQIAGEET